MRKGLPVGDVEIMHDLANTFLQAFFDILLYIRLDILCVWRIIIVYKIVREWKCE